MKQHWWWLALLFAPPYALIGTATYWLAIDRTPPLTIVYQHPHFLSGPAATREEAKQMEIKEAPAGRGVWIYREICLAPGYPAGQAEPVWIEATEALPGPFVYAAPQRTFPDRPGCYGRAFTAEIPRAVGRVVDYRLSIAYEVNPLRTVRAVFPPIRVWILPGD